MLDIYVHGSELVLLFGEIFVKFFEISGTPLCRYCHTIKLNRMSC